MEIKAGRITQLRELLVTQMNHWILFPIYVVVVIQINNITGTGAPHILLWLVWGCIPFLLYFARYKLKKFWSLVLAHIGTIALMSFCPAENHSIRIFYLIMGIFYVIYSCYLWSTRTDMQDIKIHPLFAVVLSIAMLSILHYQDHTEWDIAFITVFIIILGLYFIIYYVEQYQSFLMVNRSSAGHIPAKEMFHSGISLVLGYTGIGVIFLILFSNINWLWDVLKVFRTIVYSFLSVIFLILFGNSGELVELDGESMGEASALPSEELNTFWFWEVLEIIVLIALVVVLIYLFIKAIISIVRFIKNRLSNLSNKTLNIPEEAVIEVREKCDITHNKDWKVNLPFLQFHPQDRIRHLYKKRILSSRNSFSRDNNVELLNHYTARESGKILERDELALIYEKARYSNAECNNEDVKRMRNACK